MRVLILPEKTESDEIRTIDGGVLVQRTPAYQEHWEVITDRDPTPDEMKALQLAWKVCKHTKSNTIIFADQKHTLGIGAGQMSRVDSAKIAIEKACASLKGSAVASDAFLPFPDTLEVAAQAGATALVQPGGSIRDKEVIEAANRFNGNGFYGRTVLQALIFSIIFPIEAKISDKFIFCEVVIPYLNRLWPVAMDDSEIMIVSLW